MSKKKNKKNKQDNTMLWILLGILLVCFIMIGFLFYKYFYSGISTSKYGENRLEGIENYKLSDTLNDDIAAIYKDDASVDKVVVHTEGRIIYINLYYKKAVKSDVAKSSAVKALDKIGEENLTYYEVQFLVTYSGEDENVTFTPLFGSRNANSTKVVWNP